MTESSHHTMRRYLEELAELAQSPVDRDRAPTVRSHTHDLEALLKLIQVTDDADERATLITACKSRCVAIRALLDTTKTERRGVLWDPEVDA